MLVCLFVCLFARVCSEHFIQANGRLLKKDDVPSAFIPSCSKPKKSRKPPKDRCLVSKITTNAIGNSEPTESVKMSVVKQEIDCLIQKKLCLIKLTLYRQF